MLVDSSVWVDFLRGKDSAQTRLLIQVFNHRDPVWIAPPILQEVLQGADSPGTFDKWDRTLGTLPLLPDSDPREFARSAARLYATCRWHGITPRSANDCLIALYAKRGNVPLLHNDRDFPNIAKHLPGLKLLHLE